MIRRNCAKWICVPAIKESVIMKTWKKCLAAVLSLVMMVSATACSGTDKSWAVKSENLTVPIGAYIYNLYSAY